MRRRERFGAGAGGLYRNRLPFAAALHDADNDLKHMIRERRITAARRCAQNRVCQLRRTEPAAVVRKWESRAQRRALQSGHRLRIRPKQLRRVAEMIRGAKL